MRLVRALERNGVDVLHACGGNARCTTCRVEFVSGEPDRMTVAEQGRLQQRGLGVSSPADPLRPRHDCRHQPFRRRWKADRDLSRGRDHACGALGPAGLNQVRQGKGQRTNVSSLDRHCFYCFCPLSFVLSSRVVSTVMRLRMRASDILQMPASDRISAKPQSGGLPVVTSSGRVHDAGAAGRRK
jgi:hypothetical protein